MDESAEHSALPATDADPMRALGEPASDASIESPDEVQMDIVQAIDQPSTSTGPTAMSEEDVAKVR